MRAAEFDEARRHAERLLLLGQLLIIRPEFRNEFAANCADCETEKALVHTSEFLASMAKALAKHSGKPLKPTGSRFTLCI